MNPPINVNEKKAHILNSLLISFIFGVFMGLFALYFTNSAIAFSIGLFCFLFFGIFVYIFQSNRVIENQTKLENVAMGDILYSGGANHFLNREGVGGKLYLLENRLLFKSHKLNVQNHELVIPATEIFKVEFFNVAGFVPNGLLIRLKEGKSESFVVNNRAIWKSEIEKVLIN